MKKIIALLALTFSASVFAVGGELKEICVDKVGKDGKVIVGKDGKPVRDCKTIRIHKKVEGTAVPGK